MKVINLEKSPYLKVLFYGDSGSGKTTLLGSAMKCEETCPLLILNARGQPVSLRFLDPPPFVIEVETIEDVDVPYSWLLSGQPKDAQARKYPFVKLACEYLDQYEFDRFKSVAIDSVTQVQRLCRSAVLGEEDRLPGQLGKLTDRQKWGQILSVLMNAADLFYKLPIHVFMTALCRYDDVESLGMRLFYPFLWGQSAGEVPAYAELVGRLVKSETLPLNTYNSMVEVFGEDDLPFNVLLTQSGRDFIAKWQGLEGVPPKAIYNPTIQKLIERLNEGGETQE